MKTTILACGKLSHAYLNEGVAHYLQKLKHYAAVELVELNLKKGQAFEDEKIQKQTESDLFLAKLKPTDFVVLLDEKGKQMSSVLFADYLQKQMNAGRSHIVFCIGGSFGFSEKLYARADQSLSFSQLTFNHQMFRLIFLEQLYRAHSILKNEPYHHG